MFVLPNAADYSYKTRAVAERFGEQRHFVFELENQLNHFEGNDTMHTFQSFYGWVNALAGLNIFSVMSDMEKMRKETSTPSASSDRMRPMIRAPMRRVMRQGVMGAIQTAPRKNSLSPAPLMPRGSDSRCSTDCNDWPANNSDTDALNSMRPLRSGRYGKAAA